VRRHIAYSCAVMLCLFGAQQVYAQTAPTTEEPVVFEARELGYDQEKGIIVALGNVEVVQGPTIMRADKMVYYQQQNVVRASGNVSMLNAEGDVVFADNVELHDNLKQGVVKQFRARLADNSLIAAEDARRLNPYQIALEKAVYSPCQLCSGEDPFWQLKASKVELDDLNETIRYQNAQMEFLGLPVFYTPYLSHPTPDAAAKSGVLVPEYRQDSLLGTTIKVPYYWRVAHNQEATITPWYSTDDGPLLETDYRALFDEGEFEFSGSITNPDRRDDEGQRIGGNELRGHVFAKGHYYLDDYWRVGTDINHSSDDTYLRRYGFGNENVLFSRAFVEGARGRNHAIFQGLHIQGLRQSDDPDTTPLVLPSFQGFYQTDPLANGLRFHVSGDSQILTRDEGPDQTRLSGTVGASIPFVSDGGQVVNLTANLRGDYYDIVDATTPARPERFDTSETRVIPQAALEWRYPLMKRLGNSSLTIEPMVLAVAQPNGNNPAEITNEDNRLTELNDTNLFAINRFPGLDTVDSGSRVAYGMRGEYMFGNGHALDGLIGQNYNADADSPFPNSNEAGAHVSDIIGRLFYRADALRFGYRFAYDPKAFTANRNEFEVGADYQGYFLTTTYASLERNAFIDTSEELYVAAGMPIYGGWRVQAAMLRDLELSQTIINEAGLAYENDCFNILLGLRRSFTRDRDVEPNTSVTMRVGFKNLGEFGGE
jgi:LPS-assembly protein